MKAWVGIAAAAACALAAAASLAAAAGPKGRMDDAPLRAAPDGRPLSLSFSEDFADFRTVCQGGGRWRSAYGDGSDDGIGKRTLASNGELEVYVDPCFKGANGARLGLDPFHRGPDGLDIVADRTPPGAAAALEGHPYTSGVITTQPSFRQAFGYFEMKARLPRGKGLWPAFWMLPADLSWPPEIDVMESIGDPGVIYQTVHSHALELPTHKVDIASDPDGWHVFAVEWDPRQVVWYVDGRETARQPTPPDMTKPMFLLVNLAVGGNWPGAPDPGTHLPARLAVKWVRAYRFAK